MPSLFVAHTQYNLILASGMASACDELVLFVDFNLSKGLKQRLQGKFNRCLFLRGNYPKPPARWWQKLHKISTDIRALKHFVGYYNRILIVDDMCIQEMYALKCAYQQNPMVEMCWLEDGGNAYFSNGVVSGGMGATPLKRSIRKACFSMLYGLRDYYDLGPCMGSHKRLTSAYVTFPDCVRPELQNKKLIPITSEQFNAGMEVMYAGMQVNFSPGDLLVAMDKLDVYGENLAKVNDLVARLVQEAVGKVYYKYHPRENSALPALKNCQELDKTIALESYLTNSPTREMTVIGLKSTALQTARKMGYPTISYIRQVEDNDVVVRFYQKIGIDCR